METTILYRDYRGGHIGIMEKKMEMTKPLNPKSLNVTQRGGWAPEP